MLLAPREYGCAHTMPGTGGYGFGFRAKPAQGLWGLGFAPNRRGSFRVWISRQTGAGVHLVTSNAYQPTAASTSTNN